MNACTATSGDSATSAASHGRDGRSRTTAQTTISQASASQTATWSTYTTTGSAVGSGRTVAVRSHCSVSRAFAHWNIPVSTGYSM